MELLLKLLIGGPLLLAVIWVIITGMTSLMSGWGKLAQSYGTKADPMLAWLIGQSAGIGADKRSSYLRPAYGDMLFVAVENGHLYLKPNAVFSLFHKTLAIPFEDISTAKAQEGKRKTVEIRAAKHSDIVITISAALAGRIEELANR